MLDAEKVTEALDYYDDPDRGPDEVTDRLYGGQVDEVIVAAARSWVEGEEVEWCETHGYEARPACFNSVGTPIEGHGRICRIVPARICTSGDSE